MSGEDVNPFADPNDVNPFAAPTVVSSNNQSAHLDEYNPFEQQPATTTAQTPVFVPQQTYTAVTPATIEPTKADPPPSYGASKPFSSGYGVQDDTMRMRQEELERKAAELEKKEQELKKIQGQVKVVNNFPPLPKFCCVQPCFYHDINTEIPIESQRTCRLFYYVWQLYVFSLCFNFICGFSGVIVGVDNGATLFGVSILYLVLFIPCSFVLWYRPIYKALKSDSSFNYMLFFFVFFFQILFTFLYSFGISQFGTAGWINGAAAVDGSNKAVGAMFLICGALFLLLGICKVLLLRKDPSVVTHHTATQPTLDDYNPFDGQKSQTSYSTQPEPPAQYTATLPATIEPANNQGFQAKPFASTDDTSKQRQDELERKAAELDRKEQELKALQERIGNNNFPPFPKIFCVKPCFYHDIELEIPMESQKTCRMLYYIWQLYVLTLILNFASALALMCVSGDKGAETFGISLLYLVLFTPCSFIFWYWPIYKALRSDSSFSYMVFFFVFFFQIIFTVIYAIGIPGFGTCGWINSTKEFSKGNKAVAVMMFICGTLFSLLALFKVLLLRKVHSAYRTSGASLEKAQGEFARGVASNKDVQKAAAQAVATGVSEGIGRQ